MRSNFLGSNSPEENYSGVIAREAKVLGRSGNYIRWNFIEGNCLGSSCPRGDYLGAIVRRGKNPGGVIALGEFHKGNCPGDSCPGRDNIN